MYYRHFQSQPGPMSTGHFNLMNKQRFHTTRLKVRAMHESDIQAVVHDRWSYINVDTENLKL